MKLKHLIILLFFPAVLFSQETESSLDSIPKKIENQFIEDHTNQLNIKLELSNDIQTFKIPFENNTVKIEPNLGLRYAVVLSYKFLSVRIGIRSKATEESREEKGKSDSFRIKFHLLFEKWSHNFEYNRVKGYYVTNSDNITINPLENYLQFPDLVTNVFSGTTAYKFNNNYSIRATISQTEIQKKSAGSLVPSIDYWFYSFDGFERYINGQGEEIYRDNYIISKGFDAVLNMGYHYTFVYKHWYANAFAIPGLGVDFNKTTSYTATNSYGKNYNELVLSLQAGGGIGYNAEKIFFGASYNIQKKNEKDNPDKIQFHSSKNSFYIFFGYRFKAPKVISKPVDGIEEKIPILKKG